MSNTQTPKSAHALSLKGLAQTLLILLIMGFVLFNMGKILRSKSGDTSIMTPYALEDETWDVIFAGSSHMNNCAHPMEIWHDQGFTSYNNAQSGQIIPVSYYACKEAIERYSPKVVVLDLYMLYHPKKENMSWMHHSLDTMRPINRVAAILDLLPQKRLKEYLFPITLYHTRWKELEKTDFVSNPTTAKGCALNYKKAPDLVGLSYQEVPENVKVRPADIPVEYLDKLVQLCKQTNTELLLVTLPYLTSPDVEDATHDMTNDQAYFNWAADYAKENGLQYINYFHLVDELNFVWSECLYNYSHMNYWGGVIITKHIGQYLSDHYDLPDRREDPAFEQWNIDYKRYQKNVQAAIKKAEKD